MIYPLSDAPDKVFLLLNLQKSRQSVVNPFEVKKLKSEKEKMDKSGAERSGADNYPQRFHLQVPKLNFNLNKDKPCVFNLQVFL